MYTQSTPHDLRRIAPTSANDDRHADPCVPEVLAAVLEAVPGCAFVLSDEGDVVRTNSAGRIAQRVPSVVRSLREAVREGAAFRAFTITRIEAGGATWHLAVQRPLV